MVSLKTIIFAFLLYFCVCLSNSAKINTPRVLLPWFDDFNVKFTFEIIEGGCYTWSLSRGDIVDLEPIYDDTWGPCSRAARVSVSKTCVPPGSVIIFAEETKTGEILRGDVDIDKINILRVISTTWKLYLEEAPEAFEVVAFDDQGNKFSTLDGISFTWSIENIGSTIGEDPLVTLVRWRDTDYEAPRSVSELEDKGLRANIVLLYGQAMGESQGNVCLGDICTNFKLNVVASVVLTPATAAIAPGDTLKYRVVRARAGRLTVQDIAETLYYMKVPDSGIAFLEDSESLVRGTEIGTTPVHLMSGGTEVAMATLTVVEPHSIRVNLLPANLTMRGELFKIHCVLYDAEGHALMAGDEILIQLSIEGDADGAIIRSNKNQTWTEALARKAGTFTVTAKLHSIAGRTVYKKVEGQTSGVSIEPLEMSPRDVYIAWTDTILDIPLKHRGGGDEPVLWSESEIQISPLSLTPTGIVTVRGTGQLKVRVQLKKYIHILDFGRVWSIPMEMLQVSSSGYARVGRPHHLHIALTATHPTSGELFNFHVCDCASFAITLLEGPEPHNITAAPWVEPIEGACCVVECVWSSRGVSSVRASLGHAAASARVAVRAAPALLWPPQAAALVGATLPVLAEGEALVPHSSEPRTAELTARDGPPPHKNPDVQLFTLKCRRKGDTKLELTSHSDDVAESVKMDAACAPYVSRIRLEPSETPGNCSGGPRVWLRPGQEISVKVTILDAIGRELLDERGPKMSWEIEPSHKGIEYRATDRLFIETHPEYAPVPVPHKYYQLVVTDEQAIGWTGALKATIPEATASIQARVVAPLKCDPLSINLAWLGGSVTKIATVSGGSGRYAVEAPKGVTATVEDGVLSVILPALGVYDLMVTDLCVNGERQHIQVTSEDILSIEVSTSRALCVGACVPISALIMGTSSRYLTAIHPPEWKVTGSILVKDGTLCGLKEGTGNIRAVFGGTWSQEIEVIVFPPLKIFPSKSRVPPGGRVQLRHVGGPPQHLAALQYKVDAGVSFADVSSTGSVHGLSKGTARIKLVATDIANVVMASAESEVEVIPISGLVVRASTQTLLVGRPATLWLQTGELGAAALAGVQPAPRVAWALQYSAGSTSPTARLYTTHTDDFLERSTAEGLSVRVVPLKPGVITIDVKVRNMGQVGETRSWDSSIEILGISDISTSVEGLSKELAPGDRLALAAGTLVKLKALPRGSWKAYEDGAFTLSPNGEVHAIRPGHGVIIAHYKDERNKVYRETAIHVEVSIPHYCTAEPSGDPADAAVRLVMRNSVGRELLAPDANISAVPSLAAHVRRSANSIYGKELVIAGLDATGAFMSFQGVVSRVVVVDEVWVTGTDSTTERIIATGGWGVCLDGVGWRAPDAVRLSVGGGVTLALLTTDTAGTHILRLDRAAATIHQLPIDKIEFLTGEWPSSLVPLSFEASGLKNGPLLCTEEQRYAIVGVQVQLPFTCRTKQPHTAEPVLDVINGQMGCKIIPAVPITQSSEVELCAEWGVSRTCTKVRLLPQIRVSQTKVSILRPPALFTVYGHPHALKLVMITTSPGLKLETTPSEGEIAVIVTNEASTCGLGWVNVKSRLTAQEIRVEVERECDVTCSTLLGALISLISPYLSSLLTIAAVVGAYHYVQYRFQNKSQIRMAIDPAQTVLLNPDASPPPPLNQSRTWSRSPYASGGPAPSRGLSAPVYGDASVLPDSSFSPNSSRPQSRFL